MDLKRILLPMAALLVVSGCAGMTAEEKREFQLLSDRVLLNQAQGEEVITKLEELETKLELMRARVAPDNNEKPAARSSAPEPAAAPSGPHEGKADPARTGFAVPAGLKVVNLSTPGEATDAAAAKKANMAERTERAGARNAVPAVARADRKPAVMAALAQKVDQGPEITPEELYRRGREEYTSGRYAAARGLFFALEKGYPGHSLADNALYWVGESYYSEKDFARALEIFAMTADKYPEGNKAPDSLLKAGLSSAELADREKAMAALETLLRRYPGTPPAHKAVQVMDGIDEVVDAAGKKKSAQR